MMDFAGAFFDPSIVATVLRVMTPLLLASLGVMISDRAGVLNIGMEGIMLTGALTGVLVSATTGSPWLGLLAALILCGLIGCLMAVIVNGLGAHLIITGIALNVAASAGTALGLYFATGDKGMSGALNSGVLPNIDLPGIASIPIVGVVLSGHHVLTYVALLAVPAVNIMMMRTPFGLHIRAVGVDAKSAATTGIKVARVQLLALMLSGVFGGAAGAYLSMGYVSWFAQDMTAGRGFIAIAIEVMGMGGAWGTLAASVVIAFAEAIAITMQSLGMPNELMQMIPYVIPVIVLTIWSGRKLRLAKLKN